MISLAKALDSTFWRLSDHRLTGDFMRICSSALGIFLGSTLICLAGCAGTSELTNAARGRAAAALTRLDAQPICCEDLSKVAPTVLGENRQTVLLEDGYSKVRAFDSGSSYFALFALPAEQTHLGLRSAMRDGGRGSIPTVASPSVLLLDAEFRPVVSRLDVPMCFHRGWTAPDVGYFALLRVPASARYVVLFVNRASLGGAEAYESGATTTTGTIVVTQQFNYDFPRSPEGTFDLWTPLHAGDRADGRVFCAAPLTL